MGGLEGRLGGGMLPSGTLRRGAILYLQGYQLGGDVWYGV